MSTAMSDVWANPTIGGNPKFVLLALVTIATCGESPFVAVPIGRLRQMTGLSRSTVQAALRALVRQQAVSVVEPGCGRGHPTTYWVDIPKRPADQPVRS